MLVKSCYKILSLQLGLLGPLGLLVSALAQGQPNHQITMHNYMDPGTGMVQRQIPLPQGWYLDHNPNDKISLMGPDNIVVYQTDSGRFLSSNDPGIVQSARMSGQQVAPVKSLAQFVGEDLAPYMQSNGFVETNRFNLPRVQEFWERFGAAMPQGLSRRHYEAIGVEWQGRQGASAFTMLVLTVFDRRNMATWNVAVSELYAPTSHLQYARDTLTYALVNTQVNPQWQITMNQRLIENIRRDTRIADEHMRASQIAHAHRMNAILARGETSRQVAQMNSDILDKSHASYLSRSNMVTQGHQRLTRMIREESLITNPNTGEMYEVEAGYAHHWVSSDGVHLATEDGLYDPRTDIQVNQAQWSKFEVMH